jgi:hypothetical protein
VKPHQVTQTQPFADNLQCDADALRPAFLIEYDRF